MERLSVAEARVLLEHAGFVYLDVRTAPEFDAGHLAGAYNVPWHEPGVDGARENPAFIEQVGAVLARGQGVLVGCASGGRSRAAAARLVDYGFARVRELRAGVEGVRDAFGRVLEPGLRAAGVPLVTRALPGRSHEDITRALAELRAVEARPTRDERQALWDILRGLPVSISFFRGPELVTEYVHPLVVRNFGRDIPELPYEEAFPELAGLPFLPHMLEVLRSGEPVQVKDARVELPTGTTYWDYGYFPVPSADGVISCHVEVTAEVQARKKLALVTRRFGSLIEATSQMVWTAAPDGRIVDDSPSWRAFTGQSRAQWLGSGWLEALHPDDRERTLRAWQHATATSSAYEIEYRVLRHDGVYVWTLARSVPVRDQDGVIYEWVGTNTDISLRKSAEEERARVEAERVASLGRELALREQAEAANRAKDEFLAMLGHELRNPLAPIVTALEVMKLDQSSAFLRERDIIGRHVRHLGRLVDDLLDVSRITRGRIELFKERVPVWDVVQRAVEMASPLLEERRHYLEVVVPKLGLDVDGDPARLAQIVANLLTNAAKYTAPRGKIRVSAEARGGEVELRVSDNGLGIAEAQLRVIFEPFVQQAQSLARAHGGLGLGLAIVRNLVNLHGGRVVAHSPGEGRGSEFVITLPLAHGERVSAAPSHAALGAGLDSAPDRAGQRVLVVDDNEDAADLLAVWLERRGYAIEVAHDGQAALGAARTFQPEIALLDLGLPVIDGYELAGRLLREPGLAGLKLVAVTGYGQEEDRARSQRAGFHAHLVKPVNLAELARIMRALGGDQAGAPSSP